MLKILLVEAIDYWLATKEELHDLEMIMPPMGLVSLATYLKTRFAKRVELKIVNRLVDCRLDHELKSILRDFKPDLVGIRGLYIFQNVFHNTAALVKEFNHNIIVLGGGPYAASTGGALEDKNIDFLIIGEGELTLAEIVGNLLNNSNFKGISGLAYREDKEIVVNAPRSYIEDLDALPFPDYNFIDVDKYSKFLNNATNMRRQGVIFSSRGCPYGCTYCHNIFGKKFRARNPENVLGEIRLLYDKFNIKDFYFVDDNFNLDYQRAIDIFDLIIDSKIKLNLYFPNGLRGDIIDNRFIDKMVKAGTIWVTYAVETASNRMQKLIKKYVNLDKLSQNINYTCEKGIMVNLFAMIGFPDETKEEALQTIDYLGSFKKLVCPYLFIVKYYPGTEIYESALNYGIGHSVIRESCLDPYHNLKHANASNIKTSDFANLFFYFLQEVFLSKERLLNAIKVQSMFYSKKEVFSFYSYCFRKRIKNLDKEVLAYAK